MLGWLAWGLMLRASVTPGERAGAKSGFLITATEPAYFRVGFVSEPSLSFTIQLTDAARIQEARDIVRGVQTDAVSIIGTVVTAPTFYNPPWHYHLAPASITFFETAIEVCDAHPRFVEEHLADVCSDFLPGCTWCPWSSQVVAEVHIHRVFLPVIAK